VFPQFGVAVFPDGAPDVFGDNNADADIPDLLHEAVTDPHLHDNSVLFSAGEEPVSAMAESLSRALRNSASSAFEASEAQLPDEGFDFAEGDPFYCEGTVYTFSLPWIQAYNSTSRT
jgi:hypothetical protein